MIRIDRTAALAALVALSALVTVSPEAAAQPAKPADAKADKPADAKADKPADAKADKPADAKADKPADAKADKPADAKADKPADAKAEETAAEAEKPKATGIDEARRRMEAGQSQFAKGEYGKAVVEFEAAYEALPNVAFLFNAAYAAEKAGDRQRAIAQYDKYLVGDPTTPEAPRIKETIAQLQRELTEKASEPTPEGGETAKPADETALNEIRSLVLVESEPLGAPIEIYERIVPTAPEFKPGKANDGWRKVVSNAQTPKYLPLKVGRYHVVIDAFQDYKRSETAINLAPGQVYIFKANLSQGEFLGYLRVKSNVEGAKIFLDDPKRKTAPWARTPQGGPVNDGKHGIVVTSPGYKPFEKKDIEVRHGQQTEVTAELERVNHGYLVLDGNVDIPEVMIDETAQAAYERSAKTPYRLKLAAGKHTLVLDADDRKTLTMDVDVPRGQDLPVSAVLNPSYPRGKAIGLGVVGALAGAGGGVLYWRYRATKGTEVDPDIQNLFQYGSYAAWGLSGVLVGLSVFYSIYDPLPDSELTLKKARDYGEEDELDGSRPTEKTSFRGFVTPLVGANTLGLGAVGVF
ncbi:MAG: PEGA domain-containing protein [Deltaproteobacteria bacterium]|nr:PEGA domain-containing protein [Deltaproteobacteria bacterium]